MIAAKAQAAKPAPAPAASTCSLVERLRSEVLKAQRAGQHTRHALLHRLELALGEVQLRASEAADKLDGDALEAVRVVKAALFGNGSPS